MIVREMHIGIDQQLQKIDSNRFNNLRPEEKDWYLTDAQLRFTKMRTNKLSDSKNLGFQDIQKRYDDIRSLVRKETVSVFKLNDDYVYSTLPQDYFSLVSSLSNLKFNSCGNVTMNETSSTAFKVAKIPLSSLYPFGTITLALTDGTAPNTIALFDSTVYPSGYSSMSDADLKYQFIQLILEETNRVDGVDVRYEYFDGSYDKDTIIITVPSGSIYTKVAMQFIPVSSGGITPVELSEYNLAVVTKTVISETGTTSTKQSKNRLVSTEDIDDLRDHPYGKSTYKSPLSQIKENNLEIETLPEYVINNVEVSYIKRPRPIVLALDYNCELAESVHNEIVDLAVQKIKASITGNNYQLLRAENELNE